MEKKGGNSLHFPLVGGLSGRGWCCSQPWAGLLPRPPLPSPEQGDIYRVWGHRASARPKASPPRPRDCLWPSGLHWWLWHLFHRAGIRIWRSLKTQKITYGEETTPNWLFRACALCWTWMHWVESRDAVKPQVGLKRRKKDSERNGISREQEQRSSLRREAPIGEGWLPWRCGSEREDEEGNPSSSPEVRNQDRQGGTKVTWEYVQLTGKWCTWGWVTRRWGQRTPEPGTQRIWNRLSWHASNQLQLWPQHFILSEPPFPHLQSISIALSNI